MSEQVFGTIDIPEEQVVGSIDIPQEQVFGEIDIPKEKTPLEQFGEGVVAAPEVLLNIGTGLVGIATGTAAQGMLWGTGAMGIGPKHSPKYLQDVKNTTADVMTYKPQTETANRVLEKYIAPPMSVLMGGGNILEKDKARAAEMGAGLPFNLDKPASWIGSQLQENPISDMARTILPETARSIAQEGLNFASPAAVHMPFKAAKSGVRGAYDYIRAKEPGFVEPNVLEGFKPFERSAEQMTLDLGGVENAPLKLNETPTDVKPIVPNAGMQQSLDLGTAAKVPEGLNRRQALTITPKETMAVPMLQADGTTVLEQRSVTRVPEAPEMYIVNNGVNGTYLDAAGNKKVYTVRDATTHAELHEPFKAKSTAVNWAKKNAKPADVPDIPEPVVAKAPAAVADAPVVDTAVVDNKVVDAAPVVDNATSVQNLNKAPSPYTVDMFAPEANVEMNLFNKQGKEVRIKNIPVEEALRKLDNHTDMMDRMKKFKECLSR